MTDMPPLDERMLVPFTVTVPLLGLRELRRELDALGETSPAIAAFRQAIREVIDGIDRAHAAGASRYEIDADIPVARPN